MNKFNEWFSKQGGFVWDEPAAEDAWNAAIDEAIRIVKSSRNAESSIDNTIVLIETELEFLKS